MKLDMPDWVSVAKAAEVLDLSKKRVYNMINAGRLESLAPGERATIVSRASLEQEISRRRVEAARSARVKMPKAS